MQGTLIDQGFNLMLYGMGTVFVFLTILVFATGFMSRVVQRLSPPADHSPSPPSQPPAVETAQVSPQIVQAIQQAIATHRARRR